MRFTPARLLSVLIPFLAASSAPAQSFWVAGADAEGRVLVAQGLNSNSESVKFKSTWRLDREAKPKPGVLRMTNRLDHAVKVLYYDAADGVCLVAAGVIHLDPGQSSNFPSHGHQVKVFKPAFFDQHLITSGVLRGHATLRKRGDKVRIDGGNDEAPSMRFVNETEELVKVCIYNRGDLVQAIPKKVFDLEPGDGHSWKIESGTHKVKVFCPAIFDEWLADGNFVFNSTITVRQGFWAATGLTLSDDRGVGASLHQFNDAAVDGAAVSAAKHLYFFEEGALRAGRQTAQSFPPFRFLQSADYGWGEELNPGILAPDMVGAPAAVTYDVGSGQVSRFQTRLFAVDSAGALRTTATAKWEHAAGLRKWNEGATWSTVVDSGVTHVGAGSRLAFPKGQSYVVIRKEDGTLHGARFDKETRTSPWEALGGGTFEGGPAVAYSTPNADRDNLDAARIDVFAVKANGDLMRRSRVGTGGWGRWARQRLGCTGTPSVWHNGAVLHLAVGLNGGGVAVRKRPQTLKWFPWTEIPGPAIESPVIYSMP